MSAPEPDILRRGQAIFDRLRGASTESPPAPGPEPDEPAADRADVAEENAEPLAGPAPEPEAESELEVEPAQPVALAEEVPVEEVPAPVPDPPSVSEIVGEAAANLAPVAEVARSEVVAAVNETGRKPHPASLRPLPRVIAVA